MSATLKDRRALLDALRRKTVWTAPGVGIAIAEIDACLRGGLTSMRSGEACGFRWTEID